GPEGGVRSTRRDEALTPRSVPPRRRVAGPASGRRRRLGRSPIYGALPTEQPNPRLAELARLSTERLVSAITREDRRAAASVAAVRRSVARAIGLVVASLREGGRLVYAGAGTSGRLGVLDAAECPPTFGVSPRQVVAVMAGGRRAFWRAVEGAED